MQINHSNLPARINFCEKYKIRSQPQNLIVFKSDFFGAS